MIGLHISSYGDFEMSMVYGGLVWPVFCPAHQAFDFDYMYPFAVGQSQHVDAQHGPFLGENWYGMHIYENCKWCAQPLVATSDPRVNYCPSWRAYQPHRL